MVEGSLVEFFDGSVRGVSKLVGLASMSRRKKGEEEEEEVGVNEMGQNVPTSVRDGARATTPSITATPTPSLASGKVLEQAGAETFGTAHGLWLRLLLFLLMVVLEVARHGAVPWESVRMGEAVMGAVGGRGEDAAEGKMGCVVCGG